MEPIISLCNCCYLEYAYFVCFDCLEFWYCNTGCKSFCEESHMVLCKGISIKNSPIKIYYAYVNILTRFYNAQYYRMFRIKRDQYSTITANKYEFINFLYWNIYFWRLMKTAAHDENDEKSLPTNAAAHDEGLTLYLLKNENNINITKYKVKLLMYRLAIKNITNTEILQIFKIAETNQLLDYVLRY
jgi:hypothetical protein